MKNHRSDFRLHPFEFRFFLTRRFFLAQLPKLTLICTDIAKILPKETYKCASQDPLPYRICCPKNVELHYGAHSLKILTIHHDLINLLHVPQFYFNKSLFHGTQ